MNRIDMLSREAGRLPIRETRAADVDDSLAALQHRAQSPQVLPPTRRIELIEACAAGVVAHAREWVEAACEAKRIEPDTAARAEEILAGPVSVLRYLRLASRTLVDIERTGRPQLPAPPRRQNGQWRVPVFPTASLYDGLLFRPIAAETWLEEGVAADDLFACQVAPPVGEAPNGSAVVCVLGAGNVSAIAPTDALTKILQENKSVLLKMNPVNDYLGPVFERALSPLIDEGVLRIVYGDAGVGRHAIEHAAVQEVHITGSIDSHDTIVWGSDPVERDRRRARGEPLLNKPITSELGNVTPWLVVPGRYTDRELRFQAECLAASITNNASFNCIATKMIVTSKGWPQRDRFLDLLESILRRVPPRFAYYPGACERFVEFAGHTPEAVEHLPWTLLGDVRPAERADLFRRESFVCICAETALDAESPEQFLPRAVEFANEQLWGTLAAAITVPKGFQQARGAELDAALRDLRYGTIGVNQWPGVAYALMSTPWGGYPTSNLADAQSGIGFVHNTYLLKRPQKTILTCPLAFSPKPVWFASHKNAEAVAWRLLALYERPSIWRLPGILWQALRG